MIITLNTNLKKSLCYLVIFCTLFGLNFYTAQSAKIVASNSPFPRFSVVLDAGHGGIDSGASGKTTGAFERDITLSITQKLGAILSSLNINVTYTRTNADGLYGAFASGFKKRDLEARKRIIESANPNLVVSIHLNSFTSPSPHGAQVFYKIDSDISKEFADLLQTQFHQNITGSKNTTKPGDFYMLNCTPTPGILIECGFLSNPEEEKLLTTPQYQEKLAYLIASSILSFFDLN